MGKPRMIILIRHAQSEGNKNRDIHQTIPDHRVKLTPDGWDQAYEAGRRLRSMLRADDTLHFFTSPYRRTRETTEGILSTLTSDDPSPSPFPRHSIKVYEEPRLREQDFGNFQPCSAEMERMWQERADYGHFFYRIPNGESAADAYDRISGFNESLWRQFGEEDFANVCVLVTHGLMSRVFLMKWYHFSVEYFEDLRNVNHCEFLIMRKKEDSGKYILENNLRTWSDLKRERAAQAQGKSKDPASKNGDKDSSKLDAIDTSVVVASAGSAVSPVPPRKKWGGCPNGCDHGRHMFKRENSMHAMQLNGRSSVSPGIAETLVTRRPAARRWQSSSDEDETDSLVGRTGLLSVDVQKSFDEVISSPDGTPSFISVEDRLRLRMKSPEPREHARLEVLRQGRDFGGCPSQSDVDVETEEDVYVKVEGEKPGRKRSLGRQKGLKREESGMGRGAMADALGDQSDVGSEGGEDLEVLEEQEKQDKSIQGSVY